MELTSENCKIDWPQRWRFPCFCVEIESRRSPSSEGKQKICFQRHLCLINWAFIILINQYIVETIAFNIKFEWRSPIWISMKKRTTTSKNPTIFEPDSTLVLLLLLRTSRVQRITQDLSTKEKSLPSVNTTPQNLQNPLPSRFSFKEKERNKSKDRGVVLLMATINKKIAGEKAFKVKITKNISKNQPMREKKRPGKWNMMNMKILLSFKIEQKPRCLVNTKGKMQEPRGSKLRWTTYNLLMIKLEIFSVWSSKVDPGHPIKMKNIDNNQNTWNTLLKNPH